jgi:Methyltransferase FkbM domain
MNIENRTQKFDLSTLPEKAAPGDFPGRFREIISDPINLLIERHPMAGCLVEDKVVLHNGVLVPVSGPYSYYGDFSSILVFNRGVHEPLEEFVFQEVLKILPKAPTMLELGAYWGHYSMWCQKMRPEAKNFLLEPETINLDAARRNFDFNGFQGTFIQSMVGRGHFLVDDFFAWQGMPELTILHSDIQGYEMEMLEGATGSFSQKKINYVYVSTHSNALHISCCDYLKEMGYRIEVDSDFETDSTSFDGLIFASSPNVEPVFKNFGALGRLAIAKSTPQQVLANLNETLCR